MGFKLYDTMIWHKTRMPMNAERYEDSFEYMFVFSKNKPHVFNGIKDRKNIRYGDDVSCSQRQKDGTTKTCDTTFKKTKIAEYSLRLNVWSMPGVKSNIERTEHPAQFPEELVKDHIITWTNENETVLDCFMGSGTTAVVCEKLNRRWIGIEISEKYCSIAVKRIKQEADQIKLFK
jgi:site-specific DNA-methyltransferase (adenine-specific)